MKTTAALLLALVASASAIAMPPHLDEFQVFMREHGRTYEGEELEARFAIFQQNMEKIAALNARNDGATYGVNKFADLSDEEFRSQHNNYVRASKRGAGFLGVAAEDHDMSAELPSSIDWRQKGAITPVKNQGQCGSCWAFSTTEAIESAWFLAGNKLTELSPQQITSCDTTDDGCNGGDTTTAYAYVEQAGGLETAADYPYTSGTGNTGQCKFDVKKILATISGWKYATQTQSETEMQQVMSQTTPLSICVDASSWQFYTGGVLNSNCGQQLDHCVQAVGYNTAGSTPYWIVRNSWATSWGIDGYIYVGLGKNLCGIANEPTYAISS